MTYIHIKDEAEGCIKTSRLTGNLRDKDLGAFIEPDGWVKLRDHLGTYRYPPHCIVRIDLD